MLLLGFYLVANMQRWRQTDAETGLSTQTHGATGTRVRGGPRRWWEPQSVYDDNVHGRDSGVTASPNVRSAQPAGSMPPSVGREPARKSRKHSRSQSSISTLSSDTVASAMSADVYTSENHGRAGPPTPPPPAMHRARTNDAQAQAYGAYS